MDPVKIDLENHKLGDIWAGIPVIGPVLINDETPTENLAKIRMHFVHTHGTRFKLSSDLTEIDCSPITITDAATWEATIPPIPDFVNRSGEWKWDMEFYREGVEGHETFYYGVLTVTEDVTKPAAT